MDCLSSVNNVDNAERVRPKFRLPPPKLPSALRKKVPVAPEPLVQDPVIDSTAALEHSMDFSPCSSPTKEIHHDTDVDSGIISEGESSSSTSHPNDILALLTIWKGDSPKLEEEPEEKLEAQEVKDENFDEGEVDMGVFRSQFIEDRLAKWKSENVLDVKVLPEKPIGRPDKKRPGPELFSFFSCKELEDLILEHTPPAILDGTPIAIWDSSRYVQSKLAERAQRVGLPNMDISQLPKEEVYSVECEDVEFAQAFGMQSSSNESASSPGATVQVDRISPLSREELIPIPVHKVEDDSDDDVMILEDETQQAQAALQAQARASVNSDVPPEERTMISVLTAYCGYASVNLSDPHWFQKLIIAVEQAMNDLDYMIRQDRLRRAAAEGRNAYLKKRLHEMYNIAARVDRRPPLPFRGRTDPRHFLPRTQAYPQPLTIPRNILKRPAYSIASPSRSGAARRVSLPFSSQMTSSSSVPSSDIVRAAPKTYKYHLPPESLVKREDESSSPTPGPSGNSYSVTVNGIRQKAPTILRRPQPLVRSLAGQTPSPSGVRTPGIVSYHTEVVGGKTHYVVFRPASAQKAVVPASAPKAVKPSAPSTSAGTSATDAITLD